ERGGGWGTPGGEGEKIKEKHGCPPTRLISDEETIEVPSVGGRSARVIARKILGEIIEPRVEEIFALVRRELVATGFEDLLASGAVITGGTTILDGMPELAEEVLGLPVRRGLPKG